VAPNTTLQTYNIPERTYRFKDTVAVEVFSSSG